MIQLDSTDILLVTLSGSYSTDYTAEYTDLQVSTGVTAFGSNTGNTSTSPLTLVAAPTSGTYRKVTSLTLVNQNATNTNDVVVYKQISGTNYEIARGSLQPGYRLSYDNDIGWLMFNNNGVEVDYGGTVTYVGLADTSTTPIYTISGSPVVSSGTLDLTLNTQNSNLVFAGPSSGSAAEPAFRSLVSGDLPTNVKQFTLTLNLQAGDNNTYYFTLNANSAFTINSATFKTAAGTISGTVYISGTAITGLTSLSLTTTTTSATATGANTVAVGNTVYVTFSANSSATYPVITLLCTGA
jgi:hypothetical protein